MALRVSGKHMDIGDAFRTRIEDRIDEALSKYFDRGADGHVTVEKSGSRYTTDCMLHLASGVVLQATGEAQDPQVSFDMAAERIEKRLRRYKRRLKSHNSDEAAARTEEYAYRVLEALPETEDDDIPEDFAPTIVAETSMKLATMTVSSAVLQLDLQDNPVYVFRNAGSGDVNLVYRRADGNIGWIDPGSIKQA
ncbi:ribosome hibernation-promoting factor, HPF/YfiA family [Oricola thermophila]|uniref:Ribosome hibernation promoting factor n=1 Tax=Oricola thermophila TaxID=2742145 RepID=A0A6N1VF20_9HYPH|nr:ribosome-associated translation inhibitor RaiA [Oricola thermophila]QKV19551.1 ribosome-associated translation inhibitor RaiA [Oricola thermophila]